jgi:SSS family solute:Na+ symporter
MGGIEAVIWTEVVQGIIKTLGALLIIYLIIKGMPGGISKIVEIGKEDHKFSLGSFSPDLTTSTFWVILLYGFFINLNNFGIDQNYVQRYHAAKSSRGAASSLWLCVWLYVPASFLFFVIGSCLYAYYDVHPDLLIAVKEQAARERLGLTATAGEINALASSLQPADYGDKVMPHFMVTSIPTGLVGLIVSAILSAAMSTISSGMNASATVFTEDIYKRYFNRSATDKQKMKILYAGTVVFGLLGMGTGIVMIGSKSILDIWWELSGIFAAGMLGIFLLGMISKHTGNQQALIAAIIGILVIMWLSLSPLLPAQYAGLKNPVHKNLTIVIGTLTIFLTGTFLAKRKQPVIQ